VIVKKGFARDCFDQKRFRKRFNFFSSELKTNWGIAFYLREL